MLDISKYDKLSALQWEEKIFYRAVNVKFPYQLDYLIKHMYPEKIAKIQDMLYNQPLTIPAGLDKESVLAYIDEYQNYLNDKIKRLTDKYAVCQKMLSLRDSKAVLDKGIWEMHGTTYYIDYVGGNDGNDGLATGTAWLTTNKYTTTTVRTAGDIAYVRANKTETAGADIVVDENGTTAAYIYIIGCDASVNDPWSDASDVKPTIDFNDGAYQINLTIDSNWWFERLNIIQSADTNGNIFINTGDGLNFKSCNITDNSAASNKNGIRGFNSSRFCVDGCTFSDNVGAHIYMSGFDGIIKNTTFNGGAATTDYGLNLQNACLLKIENCTFGSTTAHDTDDIRIGSYNSYVKCINCTFNKTTLSAITGYQVYISSEDDDGTFGKQIVYYGNGTVTKDTDVTRDGGATSSAKIMPKNSCALNYPISIAPFDEYDFKVWLTKDIQKTVTIYMRSVTTWSASYPTAAQCYVKFSYLSNAVSAARTEVTTNEVFSDATTWVAFDSGAITPLQTGWCYIKVYLGKYTASNGIYVDRKPVVS